MKFAFRILGYLCLVILNFAAYVLLFAAAYGMKPNTGVQYVKYKLSHVMSDSLSPEVQEFELSPEMQSEVDKAKEIITEERNEVQRQRDSLSIEKTELEKLKNDIQSLLAEKDKAKEERMANLSKIYDGMNPERVAEVLSQMEDSLIVTILSKMKVENVGLVLEHFQPRRSAGISKMLLKGI